tara:strand:+ start:98 stop:544 length:447 start_codon:yes stop_codon:yes gene_type:complete
LTLCLLHIINVIIKSKYYEKNLDKILAEVSAGELIDKITILEIKKDKIKQVEKLLEINKEFKSLIETFNKNISNNEEIKDLMSNLKEINLKLWDIEDKKRLAERKNIFDDKFIQLARDVYKFNDERAKIKLKINILLGSNIKEVKSYN